MLRSLARSLINKIRTSTKAKALRPFVEKLVTKAKGDSLSARRLIVARLGGSEREVAKLFSDIAPRYKDRMGGYTRIAKVNAHKTDGRDVAVIEFV